MVWPARTGVLSIDYKIVTCEVSEHQHNLLKTGLSEECLPDWADSIWQLR
jgi:hypothetical protein